MAKFEEVFEDTQALFTNFISDIDNLREVNIKILASKNLKEIGKVVKANDLLKFMTKEDIIILLNETIFEQLDDEQKMMVVEELLAAIYFDAEKSKVSIIKPDIKTFSIALNPEITPELKLEGEAREIIRAIQEGRKKAGFNVEDRISLGYTGKDAVFADAELNELIAHEVLATSVTSGALADADYSETVDIEEESFTLSLKRNV
jgi:hypothetical protein